MQTSRREFLKSAAIGGSIAGFSQLFGYTHVFAQSDGDTLETILNLAATAETLACTHYYTALTDSKIQLTPSERNFLIAALDAEHEHLIYLMANGAKSLSNAFYAPLNVYSDRDTFAAVTAQAENAFVGAYLAANRRIAELGNSLLAATVAQIVVTEGVHLALIRQLSGVLPNNVSLAEAVYYNTSDVQPVLQPFLEGGNNFIGPKYYPGDDILAQFLANDGVTHVKPFTEFASAGGQS